MIHPDTHIGAVHITVSDLDRSLDFYRQIIGFQLQLRENGQARLTAGHQPLLYLYENRAARPYANRSGLYHFAILVPTRQHLAQSLKRIGETQTRVQGFADHHVSEAIYLPDPDGNGIEIYRDRPREQWVMQDGRVKMGSDPLDMQSLMGELGHDAQPWSGLHPDTKIGHIHLHVADIDEAEQFYNEKFGFDIVLRYGPSASFLSAGGYHHHIGINIWNGHGAPAPPDDATGLRWFDVVLPDQQALQSTLDRLRENGLVPQQRDEGWLVHDPAQNSILITHNS